MFKIHLKTVNVAGRGKIQQGNKACLFGTDLAPMRRNEILRRSHVCPPSRTPHVCHDGDRKRGKADILAVKPNKRGVCTSTLFSQHWVSVTMTLFQLRVVIILLVKIVEGEILPVFISR